MEFDFKYDIKISREQHVALSVVFHKKGRWIRRVLWAAVGIACLFMTWTFIVGVILLGLLFLSIFGQNVATFAVGNNYKLLKYLHGTVIYGVTSEGLTFSGGGIVTSSTWASIDNWREADGWLVVRSYGFPQYLFRVADLKDAGVYNQVVRLAREQCDEQLGPEVNMPAEADA